MRPAAAAAAAAVASTSSVCQQSWLARRWQLLGSARSRRCCRRYVETSAIGVREAGLCHNLSILLPMIKAWHAHCSRSSNGGGGQQQQQQQQKCVPAIVAGEALATVGVCTLASLLQEVHRTGVDGWPGAGGGLPRRKTLFWGAVFAGRCGR